MFCTKEVLGELIRLTALEESPPRELTIELQNVPLQGSRARAAAVFHVRVSLVWAVEAWWDVWLVSESGYLLEWHLEDVGKWLVKSLSGSNCIVHYLITDASKIPARWTADRVAASMARVSQKDAAQIVAAADAKILSVSTWAASTRKAAVTDAAARMKSSAAALVVVQAVQVNGAAALVDPFGGGGETGGGGGGGGFGGDFNTGAATSGYDTLAIVELSKQYRGTMAGETVRVKFVPPASDFYEVRLLGALEGLPGVTLQNPKIWSMEQNYQPVFAFSGYEQDNDWSMYLDAGVEYFIVVGSLTDASGGFGVLVATAPPPAG